MEFRPTRHRQLVLDWIDSLTIDWPISRLRYYHTEIPLWYCKKCGETLAPPPGKYYRPWKDPAPFAKCPKCSSKDFVGEERVFDTWMDSSVSNLFLTRYRGDPNFFAANFPSRFGRKAVRSSGRGSTTRCSSRGSFGGRSRSTGYSSMASASIRAGTRCTARLGT